MKRVPCCYIPEAVSITKLSQPPELVRAAPRTGKWRHFITPPASGAWNMALDEALLERARETGETVLRVYTWSAPTLSLGRNQRANGQYDLERATAMGVEFVRRPTGGRAVLHNREVTYSVTAPVADTTLRDSYEQINRVLGRALGILGVDVSAAESRERAPLPDGSPCFEVPTVGELTWEGRKLVGSAQWRETGALLQHGSILIDDDQSLIAQLCLSATPTTPPATLHAALGRSPSSNEIAAALVAALEASNDSPAEELTPEDRLLDRSRTLEKHYAANGWTWRR